MWCSLLQILIEFFIKRMKKNIFACELRALLYRFHQHIYKWLFKNKISRIVSWVFILLNNICAEIKKQKKNCLHFQHWKLFSSKKHIFGFGCASSLFWGFSYIIFGSLMQFCWMNFNYIFFGVILQLDCLIALLFT